MFASSPISPASTRMSLRICETAAPRKRNRPELAAAIDHQRQHRTGNSDDRDDHRNHF